MRAFATVAIVVALTASASMQRPIEPDQSCAFADRYAPPDLALTASPDIAARYRHWQPPHSPVAITAVDLTKVELFAGQGTFSTRGPARIEVMNLSDRALDMINVMLHVGWGMSGVGRAQTLRTPLPPGERATVEIGGGDGHGSNVSADLPVVFAYVTRAQSGTCVYTPARRSFLK